MTFVNYSLMKEYLSSDSWGKVGEGEEYSKKSPVEVERMAGLLLGGKMAKRLSLVMKGYFGIES